jgi:phage head maturation protease
MCKRAKIKYEDGYEGRIFTYRFTDATVDWYGDIVEAKGGDLKTYLKKHPVILAFHDNHTLPVGACLDCWYVEKDNAVDGYVLFFDDRVDRTGFSDTIYRYVESGGMRACSIGFMPLDAYRPTEEERAALKMGPYGVIFRKWTLLELSVCPVPANPSAGKKSILADAKDAKVIDDTRMAEIAKSIDEEITRLTNIDNPVKEEPVTESTVDQQPIEIQATIETPADNELKENITELINRVTILQEKVGTLTECINKILESKSAPPVIDGAAKDVDDSKLYDAILSGSVDFLRSIKNRK